MHWNTVDVIKRKILMLENSWKSMKNEINTTTKTALNHTIHGYKTFLSETKQWAAFIKQDANNL